MNNAQAIALLNEIELSPMEVPSDAQAAIQHLQFRRRVLESAYELRHQQALRVQFEAEAAGLAAQMKEEKLKPHQREHMRGRLLELEGKRWKSRQLSRQFELELVQYKRILELGYGVH